NGTVGAPACTHPAGNAGTVCRASAGVCDVAETCDGSSATCPANLFQPSTTECRPSAGVCDVAEMCTGTSATCPADSFLPSSTVCRASAGECDVAESCTGTSTSCPTDTFKANGTACTTDSNVCTFDTCNGSNALCQHQAGACLTQTKSVAGTCANVATIGTV